MSDLKKHWILGFAPLVLSFVGVIMMTVGGTIILSSAAKLALFETEPSRVITAEDCRYDYKLEVKRTDDEIKSCLEEKRFVATLRFKNSEKQDIIEGLSALFVGLVLVLFFRKKKK